MKRQFLRAGLFALEFAGIALAVLVAILCFVIWRAEHGGINLNIARPILVKALERSLPQGYDVSLGTLHLGISSGRREHYILKVREGQITGPYERAEINIAVLDIVVAKRNIIRGQFGVMAINISEPIIKISPQRHESKISGEVEVHDATPSQNWFEQFLNNRQFREHLRLISITDMTVTFSDQQAQRRWQASNMNVALEKNIGGSFALRANSDMSLGEKVAPFEFLMGYNEEADIGEFSVAGEGVPIGDIVAYLFPQLPVQLTTPIDGTLQAHFNSVGVIQKAQFDVAASGGALFVNEQELPVTNFVVRGGYEPGAGAVNLEALQFEIGKSKGELSGFINTISVDQDNAATLPKSAPSSLAIDFDLQGQNINLDTLGLFTEELPVESIDVKGRFIPVKRRLIVEDVALASAGFNVAGDLVFDKPAGIEGEKAPSFGLAANLTGRGRVTPARLMALWPAQLAPLSRRWIKNRISNGYVENVNFTMNLPVGKRDEMGYTPNEALKLEFEAYGVSAEFIYGLTPLSNAVGRGVLYGNSLEIELESAQLGNTKITQGDLHFPDFQPQNSVHHYSFTGEGNAGEMLQILDEPPLQLISRAGLDPEQINGNARVKMQIKRPKRGERPRGNFEYDGRIDFDNLTFTEIFRNADLEEGEGTIELKTRNMKIKGQGKLGGAPIDIVWNQRFYAEDGLSDFTVSGIFDATMADALGYATRSFLRGPVDFVLKAGGSYQQLDNFHIDADFSEASLGFSQLGLQKPADTAAFANINGSFKDGAISLNTLKIEGDGLNIDGHIWFEPSGRIATFGFDKFFVRDRADFAVDAKRTENDALSIVMSGGYLDLGPMISSLVGARGDGSADQQGEDRGQRQFDWGSGVEARLRLDELGLREGVKLRDTSLDFRHDSKVVQTLTLSGLDQDLDTLRVELSHGNSDAGPTRIIDAETTDLGTLFEGMFGVTSLKGGSGRLSLDLGADGNAEIVGTATANNLRVVGAPLLARLFAAGSLNGLSDLLNNEGIALERAFSTFRVKDGKIHFTESRAIGPSIGITASGNVGLNGQGAINLEGALAPAYQVNSFLGKAPLIGELLVNREGEGVVAMMYDITGNVARPTVKINPLTAFAPGVFRRAFEKNDNQEYTDNAKENNADDNKDNEIDP